MDGNDGNGPITVIRVPPDRCTNCKRENVRGQTNRHIHTPGHTELGAFYRCPDCGFVWRVTWRIEPQ